MRIKLNLKQGDDCPKCKCSLREQPIIMLKGSRIREVGMSVFCPRANCDFESEVIVR